MLTGTGLLLPASIAAAATAPPPAISVITSPLPTPATASAAVVPAAVSKSPAVLAGPEAALEELALVPVSSEAWLVSEADREDSSSPGMPLLDSGNPGSLPPPMSAGTVPSAPVSPLTAPQAPRVALAEDPALWTAAQAWSASQVQMPGLVPMPSPNNPLPGGGPISITRVSDDNGASASDGLTNDTTLTVHGTGTPGMGVQLFVDGAANATGVVDAQGKWSIALRNALAEGGHEIRAEARDNPLLSDSYAVDIDLSAPTLTLTAPSHAVTYTPRIDVQASDNRDQGLQVFLDVDWNEDGDFHDAKERNWSKTVAGPGGAAFPVELPEGNWRIQARAVDSAGNVGVSKISLVRIAMDMNDHPELADPQAPKKPVAAGPGRWLQVAGNEEGAGGGGADGRVILAEQLADEVEPNDSSAAANAITVPTDDKLTIRGTVSSNMDLDWFSFTLTQRTGVFFDIDSRETGLSSTLDSFLALVDADGMTTLDANDDGYDFETGNPAQTSEVDFDLDALDSSLYADLNPGTYFIVVGTIGGNATGDYQLKVWGDTDYTSGIPVLNSQPGATGTIFLDFNGHSSSSDAWAQSLGGAYSVPAYDLNNNAAEITPGERLAITNLWRVVSEDMSPFNLNVTTSYSGPFNDRQAMRVVINDDDASQFGVANNTLGLSFLNSWSTGGATDNAVFIFAANYPTFEGFFGVGGNSAVIMAQVIEIGNTASHETGHTWGLNHFGGSTDVPGALLNTPDSGLNRETWHSGITNDIEPLDPRPPIFQDDMAIISNTTNGFGYRVDDHGNDPITATVMFPSGRSYSGSGVIAQVNGDVDLFRFRATSGGLTTIRVDVDDYLNDLNVGIRLLDSSGFEVARSFPGDSFDAVLNLPLGDTDYYLEVGSGGGPGEAGQYTVSITVPGVPPPPVDGNPSFNQDLFEPNETSDAAFDFGVLNRGTPARYTSLTVGTSPEGLPDYDWYSWTASVSGTFSVSQAIIAGGPLELSLFVQDGNFLVPLSATTVSPLQTSTLRTAVSAGTVVYVQVKGVNTAPGVFTQGTYALAVAIG